MLICHSPLAVEMERHLVHVIAEKFGLPRDQAGGVFVGGGAKAITTQTPLPVICFSDGASEGDQGACQNNCGYCCRVRPSMDLHNSARKTKATSTSCLRHHPSKGTRQIDAFVFLLNQLRRFERKSACG